MSIRDLGWREHGQVILSIYGSARCFPWIKQVTCFGYPCWWHVLFTWWCWFMSGRSLLGERASEPNQRGVWERWTRRVQVMKFTVINICYSNWLRENVVRFNLFFSLCCRMLKPTDLRSNTFWLGNSILFVNNSNRWVIVNESNVGIMRASDSKWSNIGIMRASDSEGNVGIVSEWW